MENKDKILYKPIIDYDKHYETTGEINTSQEYEEIEETESIKDILIKAERIKQAIPLMPKEVRKATYELVNIAEAVINSGDEEPYRPSPSSTVYTYTMDQDESDSNTEIVEDEDGWTPNYKIEHDSMDEKDYIKRKYNYDIVSILDDYLESVNNETAQYLENILIPLSYIKPELYTKILTEYSAYTSSVQDKNSQHLSDGIIKNQIIRKMKGRLYNKLYSIDRTIAHIRMCKVCVEQKIRYADEDYIQEQSALDGFSNKMLENARVQCDLKYKENFYNLYRYLNSGALLLNECLKLYIVELQNKAILLDKEGENLW